MKKTVLLTFDYELFLNNNTGSIENCLIRPTNKIIDILKRHNAKGVFFVDVIYLIKLKEFNYEEYEIIEKQLKNLVATGSYLELHIHSHWLDSKYINQKWQFDSFDRFRIHSLDEKEILSVFKEGVLILESISGRKVTVFRAGGWSIMPFLTVKNAFLTTGIHIDSSVIPNYYINHIPMHYADYRNINNKYCYNFEKEVNIIERNGSFVEIPVTSLYISGLLLLMNKIILKITHDKIMGDGMGLKIPKKREQYIKIFKRNNFFLKVESVSNLFLKYILFRLRKKKHLTFAIHPKTISQQALKNLDMLLSSYETISVDDLIYKFNSK